MEEMNLKDCYDRVGKCKKCGIEYGYDVPSKFKKSFCGKVHIKPGYKDESELCPRCDPNFKEKVFKNETRD